LCPDKDLRQNNILESFAEAALAGQKWLLASSAGHRQGYDLVEEGVRNISSGLICMVLQQRKQKEKDIG